MHCGARTGETFLHPETEFQIQAGQRIRKDRHPLGNREERALNAVCGAGGRLAPGKRVTVSAPSFVQEYILPDLLSDIRTAAAAVFDLRENAGESDIVFSLAPVSGTLDFEGGAALVGGITAVAVRSGAPSASPDLLVWAPYRPLLTPEEAARVSFSSDSIGTLLAVLRRSPGSVAFLPLLSVPEGMPVLPDPLSRLYLELRLRMQEGFSRSVSPVPVWASSLGRDWPLH